MRFTLASVEAPSRESFKLNNALIDIFSKQPNYQDIQIVNTLQDLAAVDPVDRVSDEDIWSCRSDLDQSDLTGNCPIKEARQGRDDLDQSVFFVALMVETIAGDECFNPA